MRETKADTIYAMTSPFARVKFNSFTDHSPLSKARNFSLV